MPKSEAIQNRVREPWINLALDTLEKGKQGLIFVATKRSAEAAADHIAKKIEKNSPKLQALSESILNAIGKPTQQCERLANAVKKGIAFHHAGLHHKQKVLIEDHFKNGAIKIICATPTLAMGVDLPAFRTIIRDTKRFVAGRGADFIPTLEWLQMAGRAGRPKYDKYGEAISLALTEPEHEELWERYITGVPEPITSKLAVEPALRTALLALIATRIIGNWDGVREFFGKTFWAFQYEDSEHMARILRKMLGLLQDWGFVQVMESGKMRATVLGQRVAELYLDPLTAWQLLEGLRAANRKKQTKPLGWLHLLASTLELRPLLRIKTKEWDAYQDLAEKRGDELIVEEPDMWDDDHQEWLASLKTALCMEGWIEEQDEQFLMEKYDARPGETRSRLDVANWLCYAASELARLENMPLQKDIKKVRVRLRYGVKEELLHLVRLEGIGRVRGRTLYNAGIKDGRGIRAAPLQKLARLIGPKIAKKIKEKMN